MALDTYAGLQTAVLSWLARPGDTLVQPALPDMIRLFEVEATRRLKTGAAEKSVVISTTAGVPGVMLPEDFVQARRVARNGVTLSYVPPDQLPGLGGPPLAYTLWGNTIIWFGPLPDTVYDIELLYQSGVPPLSDGNPSNWLLASSPDAYLFGTLVEAEAYIGHDERIQLWAQRREAAFASIEQADRKARWGSPLQIQVHAITTAPGSASGGGTVASGGARAFVGETPPPAGSVRQGDLWWDSSNTSPGGGQLYVWFIDNDTGQWVAATNQPTGTSPGIVTVTPASGDTVQVLRETPNVFVATAALAALTVKLLVNPVIPDTVQLCFAAPVTALAVQSSTGAAITGAPTSAYGPGAALVFRFVPPGVWTYWK